MKRIFMFLCAVSVSTAFVGSALGDQVAGTVFAAAPGGGFWVGTEEGVPGFPTGETEVVAQLIPSSYDYSDLVLQVQLFPTSATQNTVEFALAPNENGSPGTPIDTESVTVNPTGLLTTYTVPFGNATLQRRACRTCNSKDAQCGSHKAA